MLISQDIWGQSVGVELLRNGDDVTLNLAGSAFGYYDDYFGYWEWQGSMDATFGDQDDYVDQYYDRPMSLSLTATLTPGVVTTGAYNVYGDPSVSSTFGVILFNEAATYAGTSGIDYVFGSDKGDRLSGGVGDDGLEGGAGNDWLNGGAGGDLLDGGAGRDVASYAGAASGVVARLYNSALNDGEARGDRYVSIEDLEGSSFDDHLYGDNKANTLWGGGGGDTLFGLGGADTLVGGLGADFLVGGDGVDTASYAGALQGVVANLKTGRGTAGEAAGDVYLSIENLTGTSLDDTLTGDDSANALVGDAGDDTLRGLGGDDRLIGGAGDDLLVGGAGADWLDGGLGQDTVSYADAKAGVHANLADPSLNTRDAAGDVYVSIENLLGSAFNDRLTGNAVENAISGGAGADVIDGGGGSDRLRGGTGDDSFVFDSPLDPLNNVDRILDYSVTDDRIVLDHNVFTALTPGRSIGAAAFHVGAAAATGDDRILYNPQSGIISYDPDGTGSASAIAFAQVAPGLPMAASEFVVI